MPVPSPRDLAREFLSGMLKDGPRTSRDIWAEAQKLRLTEITLRRAKEELGVRAERVWADGKRLSYWLLPGQKLPEAAGGKDDPNSLKPWLAPLREQFPAPTPIDDE